MKRVFIIAGDPSGDLIASQLVLSMKKIQPQLEVIGMGGGLLQKVSSRFLGNIVGEHALGFAIPLKKILFFRGLLNNVIQKEWKKNPPDAVIPVDFYGFNFHVASLAKKMGIKVFYYASPQFWASRSYRAERLRKSVDLFLCLFPFELDFYKRRNLPAQFVGHPILDKIPQVSPNHLSPVKIENLIGLLPGSRPDEVKRHLPIMAKACGIISKSVPGTRFFVFTVPHISRHLYQQILGKEKIPVLIELIEDDLYTWRSQMDLALTASGMETFENALLGIPMVVMYKTNWVTYLIARMLIRIPFLGMPNLLFGQKIVPEFIQWKATPQSISKPIIGWLKKPQERLHLKKQLLGLREKFGGNGASDRAARTILEKVA